MEILKQGTKNRVECSRCGSLLQYELSDVKLVPHRYVMGPYDFDDPEPHQHFRCVITCPSCKASLGVSPNSADKRALYAAIVELENHFDHNL